ncbi:hypothetical protein EVAR_35193_1 [Eumeta japonica]|uniref:Uncharacterized protein n=1 Tax=Eumeta variegata TaxID=151549 RepID=A0A4C1VDJ6_EUMVA|nr:hypothetical protein EVAR_35193_1 [Eumeta japonica]
MTALHERYTHRARPARPQRDALALRDRRSLPKTLPSYEILNDLFGRVGRISRVTILFSRSHPIGGRACACVGRPAAGPLARPAAARLRRLDRDRRAACAVSLRTHRPNAHIIGIPSLGQKEYGHHPRTYNTTDDARDQLRHIVCDAYGTSIRYDTLWSSFAVADLRTVSVRFERRSVRRAVIERIRITDTVSYYALASQNVESEIEPGVEPTARGSRTPSLARAGPL